MTSETHLKRGYVKIKTNRAKNRNNETGCHKGYAKLFRKTGLMKQSEGLRPPVEKHTHQV